jgi:hypothetical protein
MLLVGLHDARGEHHPGGGEQHAGLEPARKLHPGRRLAHDLKFRVCPFLRHSVTVAAISGDGNSAVPEAVRATPGTRPSRHASAKPTDVGGEALHFADRAAIKFEGEGRIMQPTLMLRAQC